MSHFFSVIICTYNRANLLPRALDSLLAQSEPDWEVIVIDDGSTDNTAEVVNRYSAVCRRVKYFKRSSNRGIAAARNIGVRLSRGRFVTFFDSDDEYAVDHLAFRKRILVDDDQVQMLHGGVRIVGDPYVVDKNNPSDVIHLSECEVGGTFVIRRDVFQETGGFDDLAFAEDSEFLRQARVKGIRSSFVAHPSYIYYRDSEGQLTSHLLALKEQNINFVG